MSAGLAGSAGVAVSGACGARWTIRVFGVRLELTEKPVPDVGPLDALIRVTQDLFILQALLGGVQVGDVRAALKIEKARVSKISVYVKRAKRSN